jgi:hypothetical protein
MLPRADNRRLYALLGVLFVLALACQVCVSAGVVALKAAGPGQLLVVNWIFVVSTSILTPAFCLLGSEQEFDRRSILGGFPENNKFGFGDGHTLSLEEQVV